MWSPGRELYLDDFRYCVDDIKQGGMGRVYFLRRLDTPAGIDRVHLPRLAAKTPLEFTCPNSSFDFKNELRTWIRMDCPNIVPLLKICEFEDVWLAIMPICEGTLRGLIPARGSLPVLTAIDVTLDVLSALEYAFEEHHTLHLDIKPENILYRSPAISEGRPRFMVSDWGIAKVQASLAFGNLRSMPSPELLAHTFNNFGTLPYMGPERLIAGVHASIASDVYSVGMMLFEMLTGQLPFDPRSSASLESQLISLSYFKTAEHVLAATVSPPARRLILRCIHPNPAERFGEYRQLKRETLKLIGAVTRLRRHLLG